MTSRFDRSLTEDSNRMDHEKRGFLVILGNHKFNTLKYEHDVFNFDYELVLVTKNRILIHDLSR